LKAGKENEMKEIVIKNECEFTEGALPDKHDWIDSLAELIRALEEAPEDYIPDELFITIKKSEWEEIEIEKGGRVIKAVAKRNPSLKLEMR
jgi:hypothetical protein